MATKDYIADKPMQIDTNTKVTDIQTKVTEIQPKVNDIKNILDAGLTVKSVKGVQRGTATHPGSDRTFFVTISSVNMSKSILIINQYISSTSIGDFVSGSLDSNTSIRFDKNGAGNANSPTRIQWQVIEFY